MRNSGEVYEESITFDVPINGRTRIAMLHRPGTSKMKLFCVHGWLHTCERWREFVKSLPQGYDIYVPDLPGYGESKPLSPELRSLPALSFILAHWIRTVNGRSRPYGIIAHSMGSWVMLYAVFKGWVSPEKLVVVGVPGKEFAPNLQPIQQPGMIRYLLRICRTIPESYTRGFIHWYGQAILKREMYVDPQFVRELRITDPLSAEAHLRQVWHDPIILRAPSEGLSMPTLVLHGEYDRNVEEQYSLDLAETLHAEYKLVKEATHAPFVHMNEEFRSSIIEFLR